MRHLKGTPACANIKRIIALLRFRYCSRFFIFCLFAWLLLSLHPVNLSAHGVDYRIAEEKKTIVVETFYSTGEPMSYAEVLVFSPQDQKVEYQNGRTDKNGTFAFCPDTEGEWRIEISDGTGHKIDAMIQAGSPRSGKAYSGTPGDVEQKRKAQRSRIIEIVAGLSVIINLFAGLYFWKKR